MKGLLDRVRPQILATEVFLGSVAVVLALNGHYTETVAVAGFLSTIANRIIESNDKKE